VSGFVLAVHPSIPVNSVKELIALAKARPNQLKYASSGVGAPPHLAGELLKNMSKTEILHVPYKGVGQSISDLVAGHIDMMFTSPPNAVPQVKARKLKALGVSMMTRSPLLPEVPTLNESGLKGFEIGTWFGLLAPAGTSAEVVNRLNAATVKIVNAREFRDQIAAQGLDARSSTPAEFAAHIRVELAKFAKLVREAKIQAE
jgi:tripartite-type tricarboxylate transporter receptor subunit TctC